MDYPSSIFIWAVDDVFSRTNNTFQKYPKNIPKNFLKEKIYPWNIF